MALYNEIEPFAVEWLGNLINAGHIAPGKVDARSIADLSPADIPDGQFHAFAGIGVWSHALRLAGVPDDMPVWTGSCPCQPFSVAGRGRGTADERHLWPEWFRLIKERRPPVIFGEQVSSGDVIGRATASKGLRLSEEVPQAASREGSRSPRAPARKEEGLGVRSGHTRAGTADTHLERELRSHRATFQSGRRSYLGQSFDRSHRPLDRVRTLERSHCLSCGEQCARRLGRTASSNDRAGAPTAAPECVGRAIAEALREAACTDERAWLDVVCADLEAIGYTVGAAIVPAAGVGAPHIRQRLYFVAYTDAPGFGVEWREQLRAHRDASHRHNADRCGATGRAVGNASGAGSGWHAGAVLGAQGEGASERICDRDSAHLSLSAGADSFWARCDWIPCHDPKRGIVYRPVEPGTFPLVNGATSRVGRLRAYGNAIVAPLAAAFVRAAMEAILDMTSG